MGIIKNVLPASLTFIPMDTGAVPARLLQALLDTSSLLLVQHKYQYSVGSAFVIVLKIVYASVINILYLKNQKLVKS